MSGPFVIPWFLGALLGRRTHREHAALNLHHLERHPIDINHLVILLGQRGSAQQRVNQRRQVRNGYFPVIITIRILFTMVYITTEQYVNQHRPVTDVHKSITIHIPSLSINLHQARVYNRLTIGNAYENCWNTLFYTNHLYVAINMTPCCYWRITGSDC